MVVVVGMKLEGLVFSQFNAGLLFFFYPVVWTHRGVLSGSRISNMMVSLTKCWVWTSNSRLIVGTCLDSIAMGVHVTNNGIP